MNAFFSTMVIVLWILSAVLALTGLPIFAQAQPRVEVPAPVPIVDGWGMIVSSLATSLSAIGYAWINASTSADKRRLGEAEKRLAELDNELKALQIDRNLWMKRAYRAGYKAPDEADPS